MTAALPSRSLVLANVLVSQAGWWAAVLAAAHAQPAWGALVVVAALAWHLSVAARPAREAVLMVVIAALGGVLESLHLATGWVRYASGAPGWPPYWLIGLWALFAIQLNVSLRWLQGRMWLAALLGAVAGPLAFVSGARLGAATLLAPALSLPLLAVLWALALPLMLQWARRLDGMAAAPRSAGGARARLV